MANQRRASWYFVQDVSPKRFILAPLRLVVMCLSPSDRVCRLVCPICTHSPWLEFAACQRWVPGCPCRERQQGRTPRSKRSENRESWTAREGREADETKKGSGDTSHRGGAGFDL